VLEAPRAHSRGPSESRLILIVKQAQRRTTSLGLTKVSGAKILSAKTPRKFAEGMAVALSVLPIEPMINRLEPGLVPERRVLCTLFGVVNPTPLMSESHDSHV